MSCTKIQIEGSDFYRVTSDYVGSGKIAIWDQRQLDIRKLQIQDQIDRVSILEAELAELEAAEGISAVEGTEQDRSLAEEYGLF